MARFSRTLLSGVVDLTLSAIYVSQAGMSEIKSVGRGGDSFHWRLESFLPSSDSWGRLRDEDDAGRDLILSLAWASASPFKPGG